jgi:hypothetical protein
VAKTVYSVVPCFWDSRKTPIIGRRGKEIKLFFLINCSVTFSVNSNRSLKHFLCVLFLRQLFLPISSFQFLKENLIEFNVLVLRAEWKSYNPYFSALGHMGHSSNYDAVFY